MKEFTDYDCPFTFIEDCIQYGQSFTTDEIDYITIDAFKEEIEEELNLLVEYKSVRKFTNGFRTKYTPNRTILR